MIDKSGLFFRTDSKYSICGKNIQKKCTISIQEFFGRRILKPFWFMGWHQQFFTCLKSFFSYEDTSFHVHTTYVINKKEAYKFHQKNSEKYVKRFIHNFRQVCISDISTGHKLLQKWCNKSRTGLDPYNPLSMSNLWLKLKFVDMKRKSIDSKPDLKNQKTRNPTRGVTNWPNPLLYKSCKDCDVIELTFWDFWHLFAELKCSIFQSLKSFCIFNCM